MKNELWPMQRLFARGHTLMPGLLLLISSCTNGSIAPNSSDTSEPSTADQHGSDEVRHAYLPKAGERYEDSRNKLLASGWEAAKAGCSERFVCFEYPELATYLDKKESCGAFRKGSYSMKLCITPILDDVLVDSVSISMAPRIEVASKKECQSEGMTAPERAICKDRVENCYPGRNSQSLVCKRLLSDLSQVVKPAELVELDGRLVRDEDNIYLASLGQDENVPVVKVLGESCIKVEVRRLCDLPSNSIVTLIGAYYSVEANPDYKMHVTGHLLALDMFEGGRQPPPPVE